MPCAQCTFVLLIIRGRGWSAWFEAPTSPLSRTRMAVQRTCWWRKGRVSVRISIASAIYGMASCLDAKISSKTRSPDICDPSHQTFQFIESANKRRFQHHTSAHSRIAIPIGIIVHAALIREAAWLFSRNAEPQRAESTSSFALKSGE